MTHLKTEYALKPDLVYPFEKRWSPALGKPFEVADGVFWLRQPLPMALDHINLWLLRDGDGWTIVDSGYDHQACKDVWEDVFNNFLKPETVKRIIVTHFHPDHIGLASWLAQRCDCSVWMSRGEFNYYRDIIDFDPIKKEQTMAAFIQAVGFDEEIQQAFRGFFSSDKKDDSARVTNAICQFIEDTQEIEIDGVLWRIVTGNGHSPEHACLYCPQKNVLLSGDQAIARISSNVSVYHTDMNANPLDDWLTSCAKLHTLISKNALILPAHQEPFMGIRERMHQLIDEHHVDLNRLRTALQKSSMNVAGARAVLFNRELNNAEMVMATGETLSHLNYLLHQGEVSLDYGVEGLHEYRLS